MKKKKSTKKLSINKSTLVNLNGFERGNVRGGGWTHTCGDMTCMGTNCDTYNGCQMSESCLHMCYTEKLYETCNPEHC